MPHLTQERYAVCIGINQYSSSAQLRPLDYAEKDAEAIYNLLLNIGFEQEHCYLLTGRNATIKAINKALRTLVLNAPQRNDLVLFYFAGHGVSILPVDDDEETNPHSEVFLAPYDFNERKIKLDRGFRFDEALGMERLRNAFFSRTRSSKVLFIFDSCYSGDFFGPTYRGAETDSVQGYIKQVFASNKAGGRVALSSCLPIQIARESATFGHGVFTHHLLEALEGKAKGALRHNGCVTVGSLFDYLCEVLPQDQRPVRSGVEQDAFELVCYPDQAEQTYHSIIQSGDQKKSEREVLLRAMLADHTGFVHDRLESFVGRKIELAEIRQQIQEKIQTGGYVTITGQAGQGKSSIIAKLVEEYGTENVAFHFIPFNPGPDHQVGLLRNLMAQLILKYDLSDIYVASDRRAALRDFFPKVLTELVARGGQEAIFIDGLDQLEEDFNGVRDLSFLPNNPPPGIVFVLGTRPDDTLHPLKLLKPHHEYKLPNLSRSDFDLVLSHRHVQLDKSLADQFYEAVQKNALYLDLVAKELAENRTVSHIDAIQRVADNPDNIFSLSIARLKRQRRQWRSVLKPILGLLLAAREPLRVQHIRQILAVEDDEMRDGLRRLGGLIAEDAQGRRYLFHLKLQEYLRQDKNKTNKDYVFAHDEVIKLHRKLISWCEQSGLENIWQDARQDSEEQARRLYVRQYYLTHLYYSNFWEQLCNVLDEGSYGRAKMRFDISMRSYIQDLDLGRLVTGETGTLEEGLVQLPRLWRYTLLRCTLTSRADKYPRAAFKALLLLKGKQEAVDLAELLTKPDQKALVLLQMAKQLGEQGAQEQECLQLLIRAHEVSSNIQTKELKDMVLSKLADELACMQQWERTEAVALSIQDNIARAWVLGKLIGALDRAQQKEQAEALRVKTEPQSMQSDWMKAQILNKLGRELSKAQHGEREDEAIIYTLEENWVKSLVLTELVGKFAEARQWDRAEAIARTIQDKEMRALALSKLIEELAKVQLWEGAWDVVHITQDNEMRARLLCKLGGELAKLQQSEQARKLWSGAETVARNIQNKQMRASVFSELVQEFAKAQLLEQAEDLWVEVETQIYAIDDSGMRARRFEELGRELARVQLWEQAEEVIRTIQSNRRRVQALGNLSRQLARVQEWERAEKIVRSIEDNRERVLVVGDLVGELVKMQQWKRAEKIVQSIKDNWQRASASYGLVRELAQVKQWGQAENVARSIEDKVIRAQALSELAVAQQGERAEVLWVEVEGLIHTIEDDWAKAHVLSNLSRQLARAQQWEQAEKFAHSIENHLTRTSALQELIHELKKAQQWERAKKIARSVQGSKPTLYEPDRKLTGVQEWRRVESEVRTEMAGDLGEKGLPEQARLLASSGKYEEALHLVQDAWLRVDKREYAIDLLPLAYGLIPLKPEIGIAFYEAFMWADKFLRAN